MNNYIKTSLVILGAIGVTTLTLQASDYARSVGGQLASVGTSNTECPVGTVRMNIASGSLCVDVYEAAAAADCPYPNPQSETETQANLNDTACIGVSEADVNPWRFVSLAQAQQICARSDKRLPTTAEWYAIALSVTNDELCRVNATHAGLTGSAACVSRAGVHDLVGNVWEWTEGQVQNGSYENRAVPLSGYVGQVDIAGVVTETGTQPQSEYGDDYAVTKSDGVYGIVRGGFYGSGPDAGVYAQNLSVPFDMKTAGIGFRCVQRL